MPAEGDVVETSDLLDDGDEEGVSRRRTAVYVAPFVLLGLTTLVMALAWGLDPLWGFMILPPILFMSALTWITFRTGFVGDR